MDKKMVNLKINDISVTVPEGTSVLEAARKARDLAPDNPRIQKNLQLIEGKLAPA